MKAYSDSDSDNGYSVKGRRRKKRERAREIKARSGTEGGRVYIYNFNEVSIVSTHQAPQRMT